MRPTGADGGVEREIDEPQDGGREQRVGNRGGAEVDEAAQSGRVDAARPGEAIEEKARGADSPCALMIGAFRFPVAHGEQEYEEAADPDEDLPAGAANAGDE